MIIYGVFSNWFGGDDEAIKELQQPVYFHDLRASDAARALAQGWNKQAEANMASGSSSIWEERSSGHRSTFYGLGEEVPEEVVEGNYYRPPYFTVEEIEVV